MAWIFAELAKAEHKDIVDKMRQELDTINPTRESFTPQLLDQMTYTEWVIRVGHIKTFHPKRCTLCHMLALCHFLSAFFVIFLCQCVFMALLRCTLKFFTDFLFLSNSFPSHLDASFSCPACHDSSRSIIISTILLTILACSNLEVTFRCLKQEIMGLYSMGMKGVMPKHLHF